MSEQDSRLQELSSELAKLAARVESLEKEVAILKCRAGDKSRWVDAIEGSFKDDPEFSEIIRLGREIREADFS